MGLTAALSVAIAAATSASAATTPATPATLARAVAAFAFLAPRPAGLLAALGMLVLVHILAIAVLGRVGCILVAADVLDAATRVVGVAAAAFLALAAASTTAAAATAARTAFFAVAALTIAITVSATTCGGSFAAPRGCGEPAAHGLRTRRSRPRLRSRIPC